MTKFTYVHSTSRTQTNIHYRYLTYTRSNCKWIFTQNTHNTHNTYKIYTAHNKRTAHVQHSTHDPHNTQNTHNTMHVPHTTHTTQHSQHTDDIRSTHNTHTIHTARTQLTILRHLYIQQHSAIIHTICATNRTQHTTHAMHMYIPRKPCKHLYIITVSLSTSDTYYRVYMTLIRIALTVTEVTI